MRKLYLIRFDDICPTMDRGQFTRACNLMNEYGIKPLVGIVPYNKDPDLIKNDDDKDFWSMITLLQQNGWTIALHGYTHIYDQQNPKTLICGRKHSEFAGNTYENQYEKIKKGKSILEEHGINTDVFFAPAHTYDVNTLKALRANGFRYNIDGLSTYPYEQCGIINIPCHSLGVPQKNNLINIAVNHPNEWAQTNKSRDYDKLKRFCEEHKHDFITFNDLFSMDLVKSAVLQRFVERVRVEKRNFIKIAAKIRSRIVSNK